MIPPLTCTVAETARMLGISRSQVYVLLERGVLPRIADLGRVTRIPREAVVGLVAASMEASA